MKLAANVVSAIDGADGGVDARKTNRVVKFELLYGGAR